MLHVALIFPRSEGELAEWDDPLVMREVMLEVFTPIAMAFNQTDAEPGSGSSAGTYLVEMSLQYASHRDAYSIYNSLLIPNPRVMNNVVFGGDYGVSLARSPTISTAMLEAPSPPPPSPPPLPPVNPGATFAYVISVSLSIDTTIEAFDVDERVRLRSQMSATFGASDVVFTSVSVGSVQVDARLIMPDETTASTAVCTRRLQLSSSRPRHHGEEAPTLD